MTHIAETVLTVESVESFVTEIVAEQIVTRESLTVFEVEQITEVQTVGELLESFGVEIITETVVEREEIKDCGFQGPPGQSAVLNTRTAGENLSGHRAVYVATDGTFRYADNTQPNARVVVGITTGAATVGSAATAQIADEMVEPSWSWTPEEQVFLGTNGMLTQVPPSNGAAVVIGIATGTDRLLIRIGPPFYLQ